MIVGVVKEIKESEFRVGLTPAGALELSNAGVEVVFESKCGEGSAISDEEYLGAGASKLDTAAEVYATADIVVKVKEPQPSEYAFLKERGEELTLFTFFHLASNEALFREIRDSKITAIAYETVEDEYGGTPLLKPMSEVAGRLSVQVGAHFLLKFNGGSGVLLGGVPGVDNGKVVILGAGAVGMHALSVAVGLGADVTVINRGTEKLAHIDDLYGGRVATLVSNAENIARAVKDADLFVGAVHMPGARTPKLVTRKMVASMREGSVIVDVAVDQGGSVETIRPTTHLDPVYIEEGVLHYGVANMPGAVPRTSTHALTNATLPYLIKLATLGLEDSIKELPGLLPGVNTFIGQITNPAVAKSFNEEFTPLDELF